MPDNLKEVASIMHRHFSLSRVRIYKRRTPYVEAIQWTGGNLLKVLDFIGDKATDINNGLLSFKYNGHTVSVNIGDFVVKFKDDIYSMKGTDFCNVFEVEM